LDKHENDKKYVMRRTVMRAPPFPHTEVRSRRPPDADPGTLADDLLNWLAWEFVGPEEWYWIFRGVRKQSYPLESTLDRTIGSRGKGEYVERQIAEDYLISRFKKAAHHFIEASMVPDNTLEWLALMQHYGAPTRLLDFTRSSYVACFFALEKRSDTAPSAIWAIDADWLVANSSDRISNDLPGYKENSLLDSEFMAKNFDEIFKKHHTSLVLPITPIRLNRRLLVQQGLFLCPGIAEGGIEKNLLSYNDGTQDMHDHVLKIIIEKRIRTAVLFELSLMNISGASLFQDLEGYASSLGLELEYRSTDEMKRSR
jgi:hypothetical protein